MKRHVSASYCLTSIVEKCQHQRPGGREEREKSNFSPWCCCLSGSNSVPFQYICIWLTQCLYILFFHPAFVLLFSLQLICAQRTLIREAKERGWQRLISLWCNPALVTSLMLLILHCRMALIPSFTHDCFSTHQDSRATPCHCSQPSCHSAVT